MLVDALSESNEQIVAFSGHVASVSQVLAKSSTQLDNTLGTLNQALIDVKGFLQQNNSTLIGTVNKLTDLTQVFSDQSEDIEQVLHVAGPGIANFYNIYDPAQGTLNGLISMPEFANPVQFICGGSFDTAAGLSGPDYYKRAEICRERLGPPLRRLTFNYPPLMFHPLNMITAYKGQIHYDTPETQAKSQTPIPDLHWIPAPGVHPPNPTDLQALMVPQASTNGPAPGAPAAAPSPFGPGRVLHQLPRRRLAVCRPSKGLGDEADRLRGGALAAGSALLAGCQFGGLNSVALPGTAGHGPGSYSITVELADVATLPQNSPVMVDDVTVGSVSGIDAVQRTRWNFLRRGQTGAGPQCGIARQFHCPGGADLAAGLPARRVGAAAEPAAGRQAGRRVGHSGGADQSLPDHRGSVLRAGYGGQQGQSGCAARDYR